MTTRRYKIGRDRQQTSLLPPSGEIPPFYPRKIIKNSFFWIMFWRLEVVILQPRHLGM